MVSYTKQSFSSTSNDFFLSTSLDNCEHALIIIAFAFPNFFELSIDFLVFFWEFEITFQSTIILDKTSEIIFSNISNFEFFLLNNRNSNVSRSWTNFFIPFVGENIVTNNSSLSWSMLSWLGGRVIADLARETFKHAVTSFLDWTCLHWDCVGWSSISLVEILVVWHVVEILIKYYLKLIKLFILFFYYIYIYIYIDKI